MTIAPFLGIDVSYAQPGINWQQVAADPQNIRFAYLKATQGTTIQDNTFAKNREGATAAGIPNGAYHFFSIQTPAINQAFNFINVVHELKPGDLPPMLDFEQNVTPDKINHTLDEIGVWLKQIEKSLGVKPIIYTANNYWKYILGNPQAYKDYKLWVAAYGADNPAQPNNTPPNLFGGWQEWALWQYSSKGTVQGINDFRGRPLAVDMDRYNVDSGILPLV
ncbi:MAG TPA: GH25 family lysozyme [Chitinophagales bacterium]|nr:GH25 family lysozyme [Chitinophagales bacterium]